MDGDTANLGFLVSRARREIALLRTDERLVAAPGTRGAALHQHVLDLIGAVEHRLVARPAATASMTRRKAFARTVRQAIVELQSAHRALPWLSATRHPHLNLGSLYLTEEFAAGLVGADVDLVVVPDSEYMYSTTSWPFRRYIEAVPGFSAATRRRPIVLNFPLTDAYRVFLHPIFAHELGHSSVELYGLDKQVIARMKATGGYSSRFEQAVETVLAQVPGADPLAIEDQIDAMLKDWCTEVLCDAMGIEIAGAPFLYALATFLMPLGYGEPGSEHPPNTVRIRLAIDHLFARGWEAHLRAKVPGILGWLETIAADAVAPLHDPSLFLRELIVAHAGDVRDVAASRVGADAVDVPGCVDAATRTVELLRLHILPVEKEGVPGRRGILCGGWLRAFEQHGDSPEGLVAAIADDGLQELLGKALELATVVEAWNAE